MPDSSVVDVHMHIHRSSAIGIQAMGGKSLVPGYTGVVEELLPLMGRAGISHVGMVNFTPVADMLDAARERIPADATPARLREAEELIRQEMVGRVQRRNDWTCEVAREHPNLLGFIGVDPVMDAEAMALEVARCHDGGATGVKLHTAVQRLALNDPRLWPAYQAAEEQGMVVLAHTGPFMGIDGGDGVRPGLAAEVLTAFPKLTLILAHCGGRPYFQEAIALAREFPQVTFDCTTIVAGNPGPQDLSDEELAGLFRDFGTHRVMFGSDWPWRDPVLDIQRLRNLPLGEDEKAAILSGNAWRVLKLG